MKRMLNTNISRSLRAEIPGLVGLAPSFSREKAPKSRSPAAMLGRARQWLGRSSLVAARQFLYRAT